MVKTQTDRTGKTGMILQLINIQRTECGLAMSDAVNQTDTSRWAAVTAHGCHELRVDLNRSDNHSPRSPRQKSGNFFGGLHGFGNLAMAYTPLPQENKP